MPSVKAAGLVVVSVCSQALCSVLHVYLECLERTQLLENASERRTLDA